MKSGVRRLTAPSQGCALLTPGLGVPSSEQPGDLPDSQTCAIYPLIAGPFLCGLPEPLLLYLTGGHEERFFARRWGVVKHCHLRSKETAVSSLSMTHAQKLLSWTQIRKVEPLTRCNSLHLLTRVLSPQPLIPPHLSAVQRPLAFSVICNVNYIIVLSHILTSNEMIDYRIGAVYRWGSITI